MNKTMASKIRRVDQRSHDQLRPLRVSYDVFNYASGSTLFEMGNTKVLCAVTLQQGVPHFLRGKKSGWLTAEYSLLPASTPIRTVREVTANKRSGRTIEISRLIGRTLRSVVNLDALGEQTIFIDCDVLQADGGTRTACITGAYLALRAAVTRWVHKGILSHTILTDELAAISVGVTQESALLDLDFVEDSATEADFNFVLTKSGKIVELQGSAEQFPLTWDHYEEMRFLAIKGVQELFTFFDRNLYIIAPPEPLPSSQSHNSLYRSIFE
ncbi:ribonuclease PH [Candidatus Dependentiae bacterium]|nr:ribonuclease PH [Candidatus Dependentiae bacterium]